MPRIALPREEAEARAPWVDAAKPGRLHCEPWTGGPSYDRETTMCHACNTQDQGEPMKCSMSSSLALLVLLVPLVTTSGIHGMAQADNQEGFQLGAITLNKQRGELRIPGKICLSSGMIELVACAKDGKEHESLIILDCEPYQMQTAMLLLGLENAPGPHSPDYKKHHPPPDTVYVWVTWHDRTGKCLRARAEDMIWNLAEGTSMKRTAWVFTGSMFVREKDDFTGEFTGRTIFLASQIRTLIATYHDPSTILDNPLPEAMDDTVYMVNELITPDPDTPIELVISTQEPAIAAFDFEKMRRKPKNQQTNDAQSVSQDAPGYIDVPNG